MDSIRRRPPVQQNNYSSGQTRSQSAKPYIPREELFITHKEKIPAKQKSTKKNNWLKKALFLFFIFSLAAILCLATFFFWKTHLISSKINIENPNQNSLASDIKTTASILLPSEKKILSGENEGRINILMLGAAGEKAAGKNLTDTIMIMSLDVKNKKIALLSLPRDLYVQIPDSQVYTKINSVYPYGLKNEQGVEPIKKVVENVTGLTMNYFVIANYDGFIKIINDIGGINVTVERDILDTRYPGPNYSYETFELKQGFHTLDGETALKFVRERHSDPQGDFGRAKRQQQVMQAVKNKMFSAQVFLNVFKVNEILNTVGDNIKTDITLEELESFIALTKQLDTQNINTVVVDAWKKDSLLKVSHVQVGPIRAFVLVPRIGNYSEIQELAATIFDNEQIKKRQAEIAKEQASILVINRSGDNNLATKIRTLLKDKLGFETVATKTENKNEQENTVVIDNTDGQKLFTLDELLKKLPATLQTEKIESEDNSELSDFTVVLGKDLIDTYKYEEDTIEDLQNAQDNQDNIDLLNNNN